MSQLITGAGFVPDPSPAGPETATPDGLAAAGPGADLALPVDADLDALRPHLDAIALVRIPFGAFSDGRGFGVARTLRSMGYAGRIRAVGHVLPDQFQAALAVGIDEVEIDDAQAARMPEAQWTATRPAPSYRDRLYQRL